MSQINTGLLQRKLNEANTFLTQWESIKENIVNIDSKHQAELNETNNLLQTALTDFKTKVASPLLTIAVTGTTSSGKSSLINLLCGADIMPRMAGEMSAGLVTIHHILPSAQIKVIIHPTDNAKWQCGTWSDLSDTDIHQLLKMCMENYNQHRYENNPPAYPKIDVYYPIDYFSKMNMVSLPPATQFRLLDLPGLKNSTDKLNKEVLKECKEALCLVTYDMAETNPEKRKTLVNEVLTQIKSMGGTLERMLFVLNRIDVYDKDADAERHKNEAEQTVLTEIKTVLASRLPEYRHLLDNICFSRLSSLPALYASQLIHGKSVIETAKLLEGHFNFLIPEEILEDLPRKTEKWSAHDFQRVGTAVQIKCYADSFFKLLENHIETHFEKLVLPPLLKSLNKNIADNVGGWQRLTSAQIKATEEACEKALAELEQQKEDLTVSLNKKLGKLQGYFETIGSLEIQCHALLAHEPYKKLPSDTLTPCYLWDMDIRREADNFINIIWYVLKYPDRIPFEITTYIYDSFAFLRLKQTSLSQTKFLLDTIEKLRGLKYPQILEYDLDKSTEKSQFEETEKTLKQFTAHLDAVLHQNLCQKVIPQLFERIQASLDKIVDCCVYSAQIEINQTIPQWGLSLPCSTLPLTEDDISNFCKEFLKKASDTTTETMVEIKYKPASDIWTTDIQILLSGKGIGILPSPEQLNGKFDEKLQQELNEKELQDCMRTLIKNHFKGYCDRLHLKQEQVYEHFKTEYGQIKESKRLQKSWQELLPIVKQWQWSMQTMIAIRN